MTTSAITSGPSDAVAVLLETGAGDAFTEAAGVVWTGGVSLAGGTDDAAGSESEAGAPGEQATMRTATAMIGTKRVMERQ